MKFDHLFQNLLDFLKYFMQLYCDLPEDLPNISQQN